MITTKFHEAEKIAVNTWKISEAGMVNCYLLTGEKRALLIDTGWGLGDIRKIILKITNLPLAAVLTHMHPDHAGGVYHFREYYVSREDCDALYSLLSMPALNRMIIKGARIPNAVLPPLIYHTKRCLVHDGQMIDLGNRMIRIMEVPGHTRGSLSYIDDKEKLIFTGDDCNPSLWMHMPGCTGIKTWQTGADRIYGLLKEGYTGWDGHSSEAQTEKQVGRTMELAEELIQKAEDHVLDKKSKCIPSADEMPQIRYRFKNVLK